MPIVQAGKQFTTDDILRNAGDIAAIIVGKVQDGMDFASQMSTFADADLIAMGLTQEQVTAIKGFYPGELGPISNLIQQSFFLRSLLGLGV